jgi:hypothetical protein
MRAALTLTGSAFGTWPEEDEDLEVHVDGVRVAQR